MPIQKTFTEYAADAHALRRSFRQWRIEGDVSKREGQLSGADYRDTRRAWTARIRDNADKGLEQYMVENPKAAHIIVAATEGYRLPEGISARIEENVFADDLQKVQHDVASLYGSQASPIRPFRFTGLIPGTAIKKKMRGIMLNGDQEREASVKAIVKRVAGAKQAL